MNEINGNKMLNNIYEEKTKETDVAVTEQKEITSLPETSSPPKKQKKRFPFLAIIAAAAVLVIGFLVFMIFRTVGGLSHAPALGDENEEDGAEEMIYTPVTVSADKELRGVWVASVSNINFPSKSGLSADEMKAELDAIVETARSTNLNAIFFQVVPSSDALYNSQVYPWSAFLTGTQGQAPKDDFDPLAYIVEKAHLYGIELHAWMNPFRVTTNASIELESLAENHPARANPDFCVRYTDGKYYYNPAIPEVREMVANEAKYIVENYGVDGIHIDDYFYPYPVEGGVFDDAAQFTLYGGDFSLDDWRRQNINSTVKLIYESVKSADPECSFGVSPFGIYANKGSKSPVTGSDTKGLEAYFSLYCDALTWAKEGYVDYLAPQIYWSFSTSAAPFDNVAKWWNAHLDGTGVKLYIGHALYKLNDFPKNEIPIQAEFARSLLCHSGSIYYGYADLANNTNGIKDKLTELYSHPMVQEYSASALTAINYPQNGYKNTSGSQYMLGSSLPDTPVILNGEPVSRTKGGYFSFYTTLSAGKNNYVINQGENEVTHSVNYSTSSGGQAPSNVMEKFEILNPTPNVETWVSGGDTVSFSCTAPAGSKVSVKVGGASCTLSPTLGRKSTASAFVKETYKGTIKFGNLAPDGEIIDLGTITFTATMGDNSATAKTALMRQIGEGAPIYAQVDKDYTYLKKSPSSSFYDDYTPSSPGMRDYIIGFTDGYYKLKFGGYVSSENVSVVEGQKLYKNTILSATSEVRESEKPIYKENYTELRFGVLENVPIDVWVNGKEVTIVLYDTLPETMPEMQLCDNPLFEKVTVKPGASGKTVLYTATLKDEKNYYGFELVYESSFVKIRFNNPIGLSDDAEKPLSGKRIYVDAGHGGTDIGARGPGEPELRMTESSLNLLIANSLVEKLTALGADVYTTRTDDVTFDLYERLDMISAVVPDMLISVHHNSVADSVNATRARGYLGLYSNNSGILLAETVSDSVCSQLNRYQRATAYQKLAMARDHRFPSTLCEMSFISNIEEFQWTITDGNIDRSAQALCDGILEFFEKQEAYK